MKKTVVVYCLLCMSLAAIVICSEGPSRNGVMTDLIVAKPAAPA